MMSEGVREARPRAAIVAVAKNEGVYLHEWIAYHKLLGFDDILVYDNESTDGSGALLEELEEDGLVTATPWSVDPEISPQTTAYADGFKRLGEDYGWVAFIDLDEFFVLPRHETIHELLAELDGTNAIGVNWKNFGSSGLERYSPEPVIERFTRCSEASYGRNLRVKPLAPTKYLKAPTQSVHKAKMKAPGQYVDITGAKIEDGRSRQPNHDTIRLNHYYTKSLEEWEWKQARGRGGKPAALAERKHWYPDFADRDRNEAVESDIVKRLPALRQLMRRTAPRTVPSLPPRRRPGPSSNGGGTESEGAPASAGDPAGPPARELDPETAAALAQEALPALEKLGWVHSRQAKRPVDAEWNPIPWYTYPAVAFLQQRLRPDFTVFEYGSGLSTVWWAERVERVAAVEHDERWVEELKPQLPENADVRFVELEPDGEYARAAASSEFGPFDIVVIDGRDRVNCALNAVPALSERGVVVWDNADRGKYRPGHRFLAQQGFRRVPFIGMGARIARVWDTSIFYRDGNCLGL